MFAKKNDPFGKSGSLNFRLKSVLVITKLRGGFSNDDDGGVRIVFEHVNGGINEHINSFGGADAAKDSNSKLTWEPEGFLGFFFVDRRLVAF